MKSLRAGALVALSALLLAACGGSAAPQRVSATTYAASLCQAFGPFERDIFKRQSALGQVRGESPAKGKQTLVSFLSALRADTDHAGAKMRAAGVPGVPQGRLVSTRLIAMFDRLGRTLHRAEGRARALPTSSPAAFSSAASSLAADVRRSVGSAGAGLAGVKVGALERAATKVPACRSLS